MVVEEKVMDMEEMKDAVVVKDEMVAEKEKVVVVKQDMNVERKVVEMKELVV